MPHKQLPDGQWYHIAPAHTEINESDVIRLFRENTGITLHEDQIRINYHRMVGQVKYGATICFTKENVLDALMFMMNGANLYGVPVKLNYDRNPRAGIWFQTNDAKLAGR